jgi:cyclase
MPLQPRIIPVLLLHKGGLYKTKQFNNPLYIGDPINTVRIFNEKEVDELLILDIDCSKERKNPDYQLIEEIVSEAFVPVGYGGGVFSLDIAKKIFQLGVEKVVINSALHKSLSLLEEISSVFGAQAVVASIDYKKSLFGGTKAYFNNGSLKSDYSPRELAKIMSQSGAGELILNSINREGTYQGYDLELLQEVLLEVNLPVVVSGGASTLADFEAAQRVGASGMAAGSMFVYQRPHNAVLISYPSNYFYK